MTDRYHTLTVVLERDTREDDAQCLIDAIAQLRGVASVTGVVADFCEHMAVERAKSELRAKLWEVLNA